MEFLIAVDLEGIHGVVGTPFQTLTECEDYKKAIEGAELEVDTVAKTLFENGATKVAVWDNHGGKDNIDFGNMDPRIIKIKPTRGQRRYDFVKEHNFTGVLFMGYHAMEGTFGGVLAHTFSSVGIQYVKLNGKPVGELAIDSYICKAFGIPAIFVSSDDKGVREMLEFSPRIASVVTKYGERRNQAKLKDRETVLNEMKENTKKAISLIKEVEIPDFPKIAHLEIRYTRAERADQIYDKVINDPDIPMYRGEDSHVLHFEITNPQFIPALL